MQIDPRFTLAVNRRPLFKGLVMALLWLVTSVAVAESVIVVLVADERLDYHKQFTDSFKKHLESDNGVELVSIASDSISLAEQADFIKHKARLVVTVGSSAAENVMALDSAVTTLHAMLTSGDFLALEARYPQRRMPHGVLYIEQPLSRYLSLIKSVFPEDVRVTSLHGQLAEENRIELDRQARLQGVNLEEVVIADESELSQVLNEVMPKTEVLLALPDPQVVNRKTAKMLIYGAFRNHVPLVGYSQAIVKAGALMAVFSTPSELGRQAAEVASAALRSKTPSVPRFSRPRYYSVSVNYQIARAIKLSLPDEKTIVERMREMEK